MTNWIGKRLGRVHIESLLARGGMAEVYLGTHTTLQRKVAVKILRNYYTDDPRLRSLERFELEARAVAKLRHPNIVQVFDFDTVDDQPYLVMEYIPGPPLSKYLAALHSRGDRLGLPLISRLLTQIAGALQYAHERGVIHRDVKPGNILLASRSVPIVPGETLPLDLEPILTDFGLVRFLNASRQTVSGLITGTPAYMSPEQAKGEATDGRTDIYSLGIVLYEMLSGKVPFDAESTMSILFKHMHEAPAPIPGLSPVLQRVLDRALAKNVDDRFQEPREFAAAFDAALEGTSQASTLVTIPQVLNVATSKKVTPSKRRTNWTWMPAVLAGALIIIASASLLLNGRLGATNVETPTNPASAISDTPVLSIPLTSGATTRLHFQDGDAVLSRATLIAQGMPQPPLNSQYTVWLVNEQDRLVLGVLHVDENGKGELTFDDPQDRDLLAYYDQVEITIEPNAVSDPNGSPGIAYAYALPEAGIPYLRGLMVSFPGIPEQVGLIHGLNKNVKLIDEAGRDMLSDYENGNEAGARQNAESIINILVGNQSPDHKDWDGDGQVTDPGDGYGLFLNGNNLGYFQAVYSYADYAVNSPGASRNMIVNGEDVKVCSENLARWAPELRNDISTIFNAASLSELAQEIQRSAELADQMLNGVDKNEDGEIEPTSEECGVLVAYESTYHMADMPLLPVTANPLAQGALTPTAQTATPATPLSPFMGTPTKQPGQNALPMTVAPTSQSQPTSPSNNNNQPKPTKKPKPTDRPNPPNPGPNPHPTNNRP
ncbi:MAG TPA: protein kinase [Anaerolineales bacterium]